MAHLCSTQALFDLSRTMAAPLLAGTTFPWEALAGLEKFIFQLGESLSSEQYERMGDYVWAAKTARIAKSAYLGGPCIIGPGTEVRHGAFIRGAALVGEGCVVGNSVELKNCVLFDGAQVPHFECEKRQKPCCCEGRRGRTAHRAQKSGRHGGRRRRGGLQQCFVPRQRAGPRCTGVPHKLRARLCAGKPYL